jgi:hypothetical protein
MICPDNDFPVNTHQAGLKANKPASGIFPGRVEDIGRVGLQPHTNASEATHCSI